MKPLSTTSSVSIRTSTTIAIKTSASLSSILFAVLLAASVLPVMNVNNEAVMLDANNRDRRYRRNTGGPRRRRQRRRSPPSLLPLVALFILSRRTCDYECRRLTKILDKRVWRQWYLVEVYLVDNDDDDDVVSALWRNLSLYYRFTVGLSAGHAMRLGIQTTSHWVRGWEQDICSSSMSAFIKIIQRRRITPTSDKLL